MSRRRRYRKPPASRSYRAGKRGRHKRADSPETGRWNAEHLIPERPPWLPLETYTKLADLRRSL